MFDHGESWRVMIYQCLLCCFFSALSFWSFWRLIVQPWINIDVENPLFVDHFPWETVGLPYLWARQSILRGKPERTWTNPVIGLFIMLYHIMENIPTFISGLYIYISVGYNHGGTYIYIYILAISGLYIYISVKVWIYIYITLYING